MRNSPSSSKTSPIDRSLNDVFVEILLRILSVYRVDRHRDDGSRDLEQAAASPEQGRQQGKRRRAGERLPLRRARLSCTPLRMDAIHDPMNDKDNAADQDEADGETDGGLHAAEPVRRDHEGRGEEESQSNGEHDRRNRIEHGRTLYPPRDIRRLTARDGLYQRCKHRNAYRRDISANRKPTPAAIASEVIGFSRTASTTWPSISPALAFMPCTAASPW